MHSPEDLRSRRDAVSRSWDLSSGAVLVPGGLPVPIPGTDQFHEFHAHPEFTYLSGARTPGSALAFDPGEGWVLFAPVAGIEERVWVGAGEDLEALAASTGLRVRPLGELSGWLERRRGETLALLGNDDITHHPAAYGVEGWPALELASARNSRPG